MTTIRSYERKLRMRRPEIALYYDIIFAIEQHGTKSYTKIQNSANLEYERMLKIIKKMQKNDMLDDALNITPKGKDFMRDMEPIRSLVLKLYKKYLDK
ncbi:MAG: winged helix-turn-helix domain-containing protein [Candidatus Nitrosotenuis sp.]